MRKEFLIYIYIWKVCCFPERYIGAAIGNDIHSDFIIDYSHLCIAPILRITAIDINTNIGHDNVCFYNVFSFLCCFMHQAFSDRSFP